MSKMTKDQKNRYAIAEKVITRDALASGIPMDDLISVADYVERGAVWRKPAKKKRRRAGRSIGTAYVDLKLREPSPVPGLSPAAWEAALKTAEKAGRSREEAEKHLNKCSLCRELAEKDANGELFTVEEAAAITDTPLQEEPDATSGQPLGEDPGDRQTLMDWAEAIRQQDAAREAAREARDLEVDPEEEKEEVDRIAERNNDYQDDGRPSWDSRPEVRTVTLTPASAPVDKRIAEEAMGLVPGSLDEELTITNEGTFLPDGRPAEKARAEAKEPEVQKGVFPIMPIPHEEADAAQLNEGSANGCLECQEELKRRRRRDDALGRGRAKLAVRPLAEAAGAEVEPLDEDELLAVAGTEQYPPNDEEPSRERKIRNRKGEVRTFREGDGAAGWTNVLGDPWLLHFAWTSSEMSRRGPWHVV